MPRTICPQIKGIYRNNEAPNGYTFPYLYIPENHPDAEYWAIDAYECKKHGELNPDKQCPEPHIATDFGDLIGVTNVKRTTTNCSNYTQCLSIDTKRSWDG